MLDSEQKSSNYGIGVVLALIGLAFIVVSIVFMVQEARQLQSVAEMPRITATAPVDSSAAKTGQSETIRAAVPLAMWSILLLSLIVVLIVAGLLLRHWALRTRRSTTKDWTGKNDYCDAWTLSGKQYDKHNKHNQ